MRGLPLTENQTTSLAAVQSLYDQGLYLQAYRIAEQRGPLASWKTTDERVLAGRLCYNLGGPRLGYAHHLRAWRQDPGHIDATYYYARVMLGRLGGLPTWRFLDANVPNGWGTPVQQADMATLRAVIASTLRDFEVADYWLKVAEKVAPDHTWIHVEKASVFEAQDRYEAALESAEQALELRPFFRPAVQSRGHLLVLLGRDDEALAFLEEATRHIESNGVVWQLAQLQTELGMTTQVHESVERMVELTPLRDRLFEEWFHSRRCDAAYRGGNFALATELAGKIDHPYYKQLKENLEAAPADAKRVMLSVPFVRQHRVTCAPATLSAVSRLWNMPADHLSVAEEICYDGTPYASERNWAQRSGWAVREFTLNWESAVALIDRGIAFTLSTTETTSAHLQAVIGYDSRKKVLLVRDPFVREVREFLAQQTLDRYKHVGPRAMAMVPADREHLFNGLDLPDASLWDLHHQLMVALNEHNRKKAYELYDAMFAAAPEHRLTLDSRLSLALYDADPVTELDCIEELLKLYPDSRLWALMKSSRLRRLGRRDEYMTLMRDLSQQKDAEPVFALYYSGSLREDARHRNQALKLTRKATRMSRDDPQGYHQLASILWDMRQFDEAMQAYRAAACLGDKNEFVAESYFIAARHLRKEEEAMRFLRDRFERFGKKSPDPGKTLFWALDEVGQLSEAFEVLEKIIATQGEDGSLKLFAAEMYAQRGETVRAEELLEQARGKAREPAWLRAAAIIANYRGELRESLAHWARVIELEPLALDAHRAYTFRLEEIEGRLAAMKHLDELIERFPHQLSLREFQTAWLRREDPKRCEASLRTLIELHPENAWAHRELASLLGELQRFDEGLVLMESAGELEPESGGYHNVMADLLIGQGKLDEARVHLRKAISMDIENDWALQRLVAIAQTLPQRREELNFIVKQLRDGVTFGGAILSFHDAAIAAMEPQELLKVLREAHQARKDLWHTWSALGRQLMQANLMHESIALLTEAAQRFPLMPKLWLDLAEGYRLNLDREGELAALQKAVEVRPDWLVPLRKLAEAHDREGDLEEAKQLLERAVARDPIDPVSHGTLAEAYWKLGDREAALEAIERALSLSPEYAWAWGRFDEWCQQMKCPQRVSQLARTMAKRRPGDPQSWLALADALYEGDHFKERLAAIDHAIKLSPRLIAGHDRRVVLLAEARRFEEARKACKPAIFGSAIPLILRARAAWIESARGSIDTAIEQMREVLHEDDSLYWGWTKLSDWCAQKEDTDGLVIAATNLARLAPNDPQSLANLAFARLRADNREGAKAALVRAFALVPDYHYVGDKLFELQVEDKDYSAASETLERHRPHMIPGAYLAYSVQLAAAQKQHDEAVRHFTALVHTPSERWLVDSIAAGAMQSAGWIKDVNHIISHAATDADVNPAAVAAMIAAHAVDSKYVPCNTILKRLDPQSEVWISAMEALLDTAARKRHHFAIAQQLKRYREAIVAQTRLWGQVSFGLLQSSKLRECVNWTADWHQREDAKPWMLVNAADARRCLNQFEEALAINHHALLLPPDNGSVHHELWIGFEAVMAGDLQGAMDAVAHIERASLDDYLKLLHQLIEVMATMVAAPAGEGHVAYAQGRLVIRQALAGSPWIKEDAAMKMALRRVSANLSQRKGGIIAKFAHWSLLAQLMNFKLM